MERARERERDFHTRTICPKTLTASHHHRHRHSVQSVKLYVKFLSQHVIFLLNFSRCARSLLLLFLLMLASFFSLFTFRVCVYLFSFLHILSFDFPMCVPFFFLQLILCRVEKYTTHHVRSFITFFTWVITATTLNKCILMLLFGAVHVNFRIKYNRFFFAFVFPFVFAVML